MITRRHFTMGVCTAIVGYGLAGKHDRAHATSGLSDKLPDALARIEAESGGRLGVAVFDSLTGARSGHRVDERFPMCSTFKLLAVAAVLSRADAGQERLDRRIPIRAGDILSYAPVTKERIGDAGMSIRELCEAAMTVSDNTAANLLLASLGGPAGVTAYARSIGDAVTRLDRIEPGLNEAIPGDPRDTTTPAAMASDIHSLVLGSVLSAEAKDLLTGWLQHNKTGDHRLRAGVPNGWRIGDKTGSGERGTSNDIGIVWPPDRAPVIVTIYLTESTAASEQREATLASVGRAVSAALNQS